jgi:hypothetical protein
VICIDTRKFRANENLYVSVIILHYYGEYKTVIGHKANNSKNLNIATGVHTSEKSFDPIRFIVLGNRTYSDSLSRNKTSYYWIE